MSIINSSPMNIVMHVAFQISLFIFLDIYQGVEWLDHMVVLFSVLCGVSVLFSIGAAPTYVPVNSVGGVPLATPSPAFAVCILCHNGHNDWCAVISHCSFDLHFSNN